MNNIVLDFRHNYERGERLESAELVYQYDAGRTVEAYVPETEANFFLHVGFENDPTLAVIDEVTVEQDAEEGGYKITADIPDSILTRYGTLLIYVVAADGDKIVTTYEGQVPVRNKATAEDYVVPDEEAVSIIERARVAANDAETAAANAATAQTAAEAAAAEAMSGTPEGYAQLVSDVTDLKADILNFPTGTYPEMSVGNADQLTSTQYTEDKVPYLYRKSGGSVVVGDREEDVVVGGTVAWNQLVKNGNFETTASWRGDDGTLTTSGNVGTYTITSLSGNNYGNRIVQDISGHIGHKFMLTVDVNAPYSNAVSMYARGIGKSIHPVANTWCNISTVGISATGPLLLFADTTYNYSVGDSVKYRNAQVVDLTQMFGSTIADYIYSLEQATAGAGVAWFKKLFPADYYEYDAGTLKSVSGLLSHDMVGFNQWDEEWELGGINTSTGALYSSTTSIRGKNKIRILPNTTYYIAQPSRVTGVYMYDENDNFIVYDYPGLNIFSTPSNAAYLRIGFQIAYGTTYNHDICINLSDPTKNGTYEPYTKHSYPLDSTLTLRGIPKLDAQNNLYYDGDVYEPDGTVTRRYGVVTFDGSETWSKRGNPEGSYVCNNNSFVPLDADTQVTNVNLITNAYPTVTWAVAQDVDKVVSLYYYKGLHIHDSSFANVDALKAYLASHPIVAVYELATPTTETAGPYQHIQVCDDFGTEEYVTDSIVPVGHSTRYPANLRDKLQHLPDLADSDGYYMINQVNKQMSLERFRIPKAPTADGTYTLKATVSGGTPTYTWVTDA